VLGLKLIVGLNAGEGQENLCLIINALGLGRGGVKDFSLVIIVDEELIVFVLAFYLFLVLLGLGLD
jgi:hypothetical protein